MSSSAIVTLYNLGLAFLRYRWLIVLAILLLLATASLVLPGIVFADGGTGDGTCPAC